MSDRIKLTGLRGWGRHGVFPEERRDGQEFVVDVELDVDLDAPARSDDVKDTVDYGVLVEVVHRLIVGEPVNLIETLAQRIAQAAISFDGVESVTVTVHKPSAPVSAALDDVSVTIVRSR